MILGANHAVQSLPSSVLTGQTRAVLQRFVPFPAVAIGVVANMLIMRRRELFEGLTVRDTTGRDLGSSIAAAKIALTQTGYSRGCLAAFNLVIPPVIMTALERSTRFRAHPRLHLPVQTVVCCFAFITGVPISTALYDQHQVVPLSALEHDMQRAAGEAGLDGVHVSFNRGV